MKSFPRIFLSGQELNSLSIIFWNSDLRRICIIFCIDLNNFFFNFYLFICFPKFCFRFVSCCYHATFSANILSDKCTNQCQYFHDLLSDYIHWVQNSTVYKKKKKICFYTYYHVLKLGATLSEFPILKSFNN